MAREWQALELQNLQEKAIDLENLRKKKEALNAFSEVGLEPEVARKLEEEIKNLEIKIRVRKQASLLQAKAKYQEKLSQLDETPEEKIEEKSHVKAIGSVEIALETVNESLAKLEREIAALVGKSVNLIQSGSHIDNKMYVRLSDIPAVEASRLIWELWENTTAVSLTLEGELSDTTILAVADGLKHNEHITHLSFRDNAQISEKGMAYLLDALSKNKTIINVDLGSYRINEVEANKILALLNQRSDIRCFFFVRPESNKASSFWSKVRGKSANTILSKHILRAIEGALAENNRNADISGLLRKMDPERIGSDHLPMRYENIQVGPVLGVENQTLSLSALNWNMYGLGLPCGFSDCERNEQADLAFYERRMDRNAQTILGVNPDFGTFQEAPLPSDLQKKAEVRESFVQKMQQKGYGVYTGGEAGAKLGFMTLIHPRVLMPGTKIKEEVVKGRPNYEDHILAVSFTLSNGKRVTVYNIHANYDGSAESIAAYLKERHASHALQGEVNEIVFTFGDLNHMPDPGNTGRGVPLTSVVSPRFAQGEFAYAATDAGYVSRDEQGHALEFLEGQVLDPETCAPLPVRTSYGLQPDCLRVGACVDVSNNDPTLTQLQQLGVLLQRAYDLREGQVVYTLSQPDLAGNFEKYLKTEGLDSYQVEVMGGAPYMTYILPADEVQERLTKQASKELKKMDVQLDKVGLFAENRAVAAEAQAPSFSSEVTGLNQR